MTDAQILRQREVFRAAFGGVRDLPQPTVAAVHGFALDIEDAAWRTAALSADRREGIAAFAERARARAGQASKPGRVSPAGEPGGAAATAAD